MQYGDKSRCSNLYQECRWSPKIGLKVPSAVAVHYRNHLEDKEASSNYKLQLQFRNTQSRSRFLRRFLGHI